MAAGLYLYCLREPSGTTPGTHPALSVIKAPGVNGKGGVFIRAFNGIEAVVSEVNGDDFSEMQKKAQADVQWIKDKALAHETVVEEAMEKLNKDTANIARERASYMADADVGRPLADDSPSRSAMAERGSYRHSDPIPVIPVKFGVIFNTEERLAETLKRQHAAIIAAFDRIRAKQEWSVKIYLRDEKEFMEEVGRKNEGLSEMRKKMSAAPAGMAYFMETEFNEELKRDSSARLDQEGRAALERLKAYAFDAVAVKLLGKELTGRAERMILNSACLVETIRLGRFEDAVVKLNAELQPKGFSVEISGPWPPYHFTEFSHD